mgnify:CR=1 FL=1
MSTILRSTTDYGLTYFATLRRSQDSSRVVWSLIINDEVVGMFDNGLLDGPVIGLSFDQLVERSLERARINQLGGEEIVRSAIQALFQFVAPTPVDRSPWRVNGIAEERLAVGGRQQRLFSIAHPNETAVRPPTAGYQPAPGPAGMWQLAQDDASWSRWLIPAQDHKTVDQSEILSQSRTTLFALADWLEAVHNNLYPTLDDAVQGLVARFDRPPAVDDLGILHDADWIRTIACDLRDDNSEICRILADVLEDDPNEGTALSFTRRAAYAIKASLGQVGS